MTTAIAEQRSGNGQKHESPLMQLLESRRDAIQAVLPKHLTAERLIKIALTATIKTPQLRNCTKESFLQSVMTAAQLGLDCGGALGSAYLVPFKDQCTLIIGYRGLIDLARRSGQIISIEARVVWANDDFNVEYSLNGANLVHKPALDTDRGSFRLVYAIAKLRDGGTQFELMTKAQIDHIRSKSRSSGNGPWVTDYPEMARKTVVKRLVKYLPISIELAEAVEQDNRAEFGDAFGAGSLAAIEDHSASALNRRLSLPDTQLSDEEAERIIQQKAAQANTPSPTAEPDAVSGQPDGELPEDSQFIPEAEPEVPSHDPIWPAKLPPHARASKGWIDDMIPYRKPQNMTAHQARTAFHKTHNPSSWEKLGHDVQDAMYQELREGSFGF